MSKESFSVEIEYAKLLKPYQKLTSIPLEEIAQIVSFKKNESLITYDDANDWFYLLISGTAKIYHIHENGRQSIIHFIQGGEMIGELGLLGVEAQTKAVIAQSDCVCLAISLTENRDRLVNDLVFMKALATYLATKVLSRTERYSQEMNYPLANRLAAFILQTEHEGLYKEKHTEVAEYLGVSYRHLLTVLKDFVDRGLLTKGKSGYRINNHQGLAELAHSLYDT